MTPEEHQHGWTLSKRMAAGWRPYIGIYDSEDDSWRCASDVWRVSHDSDLKRKRFATWAEAEAFMLETWSATIDTMRPRRFWVKPKMDARKKLEAGLTHVLVRHYGWASEHVTKAVLEIMQRLP